MHCSVTYLVTAVGWRTIVIPLFNFSITQKLPLLKELTTLKNIYCKKITAQFNKSSKSSNQKVNNSFNYTINIIVYAEAE